MQIQHIMRRDELLWRKRKSAFLNTEQLCVKDISIIGLGLWMLTAKADTSGGTDLTYARNAVKKIEAYENNNIFPGERLILTFETEYTILSTKTIEKLVEKYLN